MKRLHLFILVNLFLFPAFLPSCIDYIDGGVIQEMECQDEYLDITVLDPALFSKQDTLTFLTAIHRVGFHYEYGRLVPRHKSAPTARMSKALYDFILSLPGDAAFTKSGTPSDCVARALALWGGASYNTINNYIVTTYGNDGVPENELFNGVIKVFFPNAQRHSPDSTDFSSLNINIITTVGYFSTGGDNAHMVNIDDVSDGVVTYYDAQANVLDSCSVWNFSYFYTKN
jgi:hypothetical protein